KPIHATKVHFQTERQSPRGFSSVMINWIKTFQGRFSPNLSLGRGTVRGLAPRTAAYGPCEVPQCVDLTRDCNTGRGVVRGAIRHDDRGSFRLASASSLLKPWQSLSPTSTALCQFIRFASPGRPVLPPRGSALVA